MTVKLGNLTYHIRGEVTRYNLTFNITSDRNERQRELGHYRCLSSKVRTQILERDNYICQLCGGIADVVDHIIPWRISRDNSPDNLRALCTKCNLETRLKRRDARLHKKEWFKYIENELEQYEENQLVLF